MYVIKKFYKWEVVATYYCRTEEKARHILNLIIAEDFIKNNDCYDDDTTFEEICAFAWEDGGIDDVVRIEEFEFEEDKGVIKCPNCGSSAQVRKNTPFVDKNGEYIYCEYVCGCGCYFDKNEIV